jgi:hypothetical protein
MAARRCPLRNSEYCSNARGVVGLPYDIRIDALHPTKRISRTIMVRKTLERCLVRGFPSLLGGAVPVGFDSLLRSPGFSDHPPNDQP